MRKLSLIICSMLLLVGSAVFAKPDPVTRIQEINSLIKKARNSFEKGEFKKALSYYHVLQDSLDYSNNDLILNMAHAYWKSGDTATAQQTYNKVIHGDSKRDASIAWQQLGIISHSQNHNEEALEEFKQALIADPSNEDARYNYELLKKQMEEQKKKQNKDQQNQKKNDKNKKDQQKKNKQNQDQKNQQNKDQKNKDQKNKDQQNKSDQNKKEQQNKKDQQKKNDQQDKQKQGDKKKQNDSQKQDQQKKDQQKKGDQKKQDQQKGEQQKKQEQKQQKPGEEKQKQGEKKDQPISPMTKERLKKMNISEDKAKMILQAMRNQEAQYFQQLKRKAKKSTNSDMPDW